MEPHAAGVLLERAGEDGAREILAALGMREALRGFNRECATRFAVSSFERRVERAEIRDQLMTRYRISRPTAYRIADAAWTRYLSQRDAQVRRERQMIALSNKLERRETDDQNC